MQRTFFFFIHIDLDATGVFEELEAFCGENVYIEPNRLRINWGGFNMVAATVNLARTALSQSGERSYFILISGQDFPIKSNAYIHNFLNAGFGVEYIQHEPLPRKAWKLNGGLDRVNYKWFIDELGLRESHQSYLAQIQDQNLRKYDFIP